MVKKVEPERPRVPAAPSLSGQN